MKNKGAFLSIDLAFAILILSFAFIMLLQAQNNIAKQLANNELSAFDSANKELLMAINQGICTNTELKTTNGYTYNACKYSPQHNNIILHFFKLL